MSGGPEAYFSTRFGDRRDQLPDSVKKLLKPAIMRSNTAFELIHFPAKLRLRREQFSHSDEGSDDTNACLYGDGRVENRRKHNGAVLGKSERRVPDISPGCGRKMRPHQPGFPRRQFDQKSAWETMAIAADLLVEAFRRDAVDARQVLIEHDSEPSNGDYMPFEVGIEGFHAHHTIETPEKLHAPGGGRRTTGRGRRRS